MTRKIGEYAKYVDHPRYGRRPNYTDLNPDALAPQVHLRPDRMTYSVEIFRLYIDEINSIPNTAVEADLTRQTAATIPVSHYFDVERICRDCRRPFIFFAEEQKHWYEDLGFGLDSDCVRCVECRKRQQGLARKRERYEELFHVPNRTTDEALEMADCCLSLIEASTFHSRQTERVRMLLNRIPSRRDSKTQALCNSLLTRVRAVENGNDGCDSDKRTVVRA